MTCWAFAKRRVRGGQPALWRLKCGISEPDVTPICSYSCEILQAVGMGQEEAQGLVSRKIRSACTPGSKKGRRNVISSGSPSIHAKRDRRLL